MLNKELLLCSKGEEVPVKYEYTVDGLAPSMGIGGIQQERKNSILGDEKPLL